MSKSDERFIGFNFTEEPASSVIRSGRAQLNCLYSHSAIGITNVRIEWRKDGAALSLRMSSKITKTSSNALIIDNFGLADEGSYQCAIILVDRNQYTWTFLSKKATLKLPSLSRFEVQPQDQNVHRGQAVAFSCILDSIPPAEILWYHNEKLLNNGKDNPFTVYPLSSVLEIESVESRHEGVYKCVARNGDKIRTSRESRLRIYPENKVENEFSEPSFALEPRGDVYDEGRSIILECLVNGWPKPTVRWLKGSQAISADGNRIRRVGASSLMILKANLEDAGVYTCRASNSQESIDSSATIQIRVAPMIKVKPINKVAQETSDVEFECEANGQPGAVVTWFKNGEGIVASEYFVVEANRLRILGLVKNDQGIYQCVAENEAGSAQAAAQLIVDSTDTHSLAGSGGQPKVPSEPLGLRATSIGSRFVSLVWDPPLQRYGSLLSYHIFYKEKGSTRERMVNSTSVTYTVTPLLPNTLYLFRIIAENEAGMGKSTAQLSVTTTKEQAVPGKVKNLRAVALGPETIEVSWEPPSDTGPPALQYKLFYLRKHPLSEEKETQIVMKKTSYILHGMDKYVDYKIRVEAEGINGAGLSSDPVIVKTLSDIPSSPPSDVRAEAQSSTSIHIQWLTPSLDQRNGVITGYRIKYKTRMRGSKGNTVVVDGNDESFLVTGLEPATQYMLRVAAVNQNGSGPYSEWVNVETPLEDKDEAQVAGPPLSLKVQASTDSIQMSWLPPRDESVMIRGYLIGWGISIPDVDQVRVPAHSRFHTIKSLKPGRDYVVSLRAYNIIGNGFPIYETVRTLSVGVAPSGGSSHVSSLDTYSVPISQSETPIGVRALAISSSAIRVSWTDSEIDELYARQYTVRYNTSTEDSGHYQYVNCSETEIVIDGLRPNTQYEFAVKVNAGKASSGWSMTAINRTHAAPPSSAPRDLTVSQPRNGDPHSLTLNWQPPKYGNGEIEEYLIYYSERSDVPDKDWILDGVKGDRLSITLTNLLPRTPYFFKVQARNAKGYGPLSPVLQYVPGAPQPPLFQSVDARGQPSALSILTNPLYIGVSLAVIVLFLLLCFITIYLLISKNSKSGHSRNGGYRAARKVTTDNNRLDDLWIKPDSQIQVAEYAADNYTESPLDIKQSYGNGTIPGSDQQPIRLQAVQATRNSLIAYRSPSRSSDLSSFGSSQTIMSRSLYESRPSFMDSPTNAAMNSRLTAVPERNTNANDSNGTLTRSYHQSSTSLEGKQRQPQIALKNPSRAQPMGKIDFSDHGSSYGSSQRLSQTPPPQPPNQGPPLCPPVHAMEGYRTLRGTSIGTNPLKSFTQLAGAPPPHSSPQGERTANIVRPVVITSPTIRGGKPAGVVIGQKSSHVPIGRATAQPRVNVNSIYSPYASCVTSEKAPVRSDLETIENQQLQASNSTEELNAQMENLDTMIDDLQALQHEFNAAS